MKALSTNYKPIFMKLKKIILTRINSHPDQFELESILSQITFNFFISYPFSQINSLCINSSTLSFCTCKVYEKD